MQFLKINFILFFNFILAIAATSSKGKGGRLIYDSLLKKGNQVTTTQLNLQFETLPLVANTTGRLNVYVDSTADSSVAITVTFTCPGLVIRPVITTLQAQGAFVNFQVAPNMNGACTAIASAPSSDLYTPSDPVPLTVNTPLYFEGTDETTFNTGDVLNIFVRASNNDIFSTTLQIACTPIVPDVSAATISIPIVTSTTTYYVLPPSLTGNCVISTPSVPTFYDPIPQINVVISPTIFFASPAENSFYSPGSTITAILRTSNNVDVPATVRLVCDGGTPQSVGPQPITVPFNFPPAASIYGTCTLSITSAPEGYYNSEMVTIQYQSRLTFVTPTFGLIPPGSTFDILVTGTSGLNSLNIIVRGQCSNNQSFSYSVPLGDSTAVRMDSNALGTCTLTATSSAPNFVPAATKVEVYTPLTTAQISQLAQNIAINGAFV